MMFQIKKSRIYDQLNREKIYSNNFCKSNVIKMINACDVCAIDTFLVINKTNKTNKTLWSVLQLQNVNTTSPKKLIIALAIVSGTSLRHLKLVEHCGPIREMLKKLTRITDIEGFAIEV